jgi:hypothetical protein
LSLYRKNKFLNKRWHCIAVAIFIFYTAITLNMAGSNLTPGYAAGSIYVDARASFDIEGYTMYAQQAGHWILKGQKQATEGISVEDMLKNEIEQFMQEGGLYFKRFVINPTQYENTKLGTWRPSANTVKYEFSRTD